MKFYCTKVDGVLIGADSDSQKLLADLGEGTLVECVIPDKQRTSKQNASMWVYATKLAQALNEAGYTMDIVLEHHPNIMWTKESIIGHLWKPVQAGMTEDKNQEVSTTEQTTIKVQDVYTELQNFIASKYGINIEWPSLR